MPHTLQKIDFKVVVLTSTAAVAVLIVALSLIYFCVSFCFAAPRLGLLKDMFDLAVTKTLLSMFTTLVTAALTYIFGQHIVAAIGDRIRGNTTATSETK